MPIHRVQNLMLSADTAIVAGGLAINPTNVTAGKLAFAGMNNVTLTAGNTVADSDMFQVYQYIAANGSLKRSMIVPARKITKYEVEQYAPATRKVAVIGFNRLTATGSINAFVNTEYEFSITVKSDKQTYSERLFKKTINFKSSATATQSTIADQVVASINADEYLKKLVSAVKVGNGTGAFGLTGATIFGVEITGKLVPQAVGSYALETPNFDVNLNANVGFGASARATYISTPFQGSGTYQMAANLENFLFGQEGKMNRVIFPIPADNFTVSSTPNLSAAIAGTGNVGVTAGSDVVTFATTNTALVVGDLITLDGIDAEIKYLIGTTTAILVDPFAGATNATSVLKKKIFYDMVTIEFSNPNLMDGAAGVMDSKQSLMLAIPGATTGAAYNATSTAGASVMALLNPYMASLNFAAISL